MSELVVEIDELDDVYASVAAVVLEVVLDVVLRIVAVDRVVDTDDAATLVPEAATPLAAPALPGVDVDDAIESDMEVSLELDLMLVLSLDRSLLDVGAAVAIVVRWNNNRSCQALKRPQRSTQINEHRQRIENACKKIGVGSQEKECDGVARLTRADPVPERKVQV